MKTLVTHKFPHLDDICGIWLYRKYVPGWATATAEFVELKGTAPITFRDEPVDTDPDVIHIGVGRGRFDEHKGDVDKSATLLVFEGIKEHVPAADLAAVELLVRFVTLVDTGRTIKMPNQAFMIPALLRQIKDSDKALEVGSILLEGTLNLLCDEAVLERDWGKRVEFQTKWGSFVALETGSHAFDNKAYRGGHVGLVQIDPEHGWRMLRAEPDSPVDFSAAYAEIKRREPEAQWFLHHSKRMLLCGSTSAPNVVRSKLTLKELSEIVQG